MSLLMSLLLLQATAAVTPAAPAATTPPEGSKIVCKTINATGSRIGGKRVCLSKAEWHRLSKEGEAAAREIQDTYSKPAEGN